ncbi:hypothetical protein UFOVP9_28 [uncultured Caudovirales phage]|jgi:hypothetical protein|uniref:Uncharacterized protein n=1 Tax=uncultured Caudovirales phage TaxID=2100421 RepID=A0A6J5KGU6_9CAUD|nr:hypothetical protein UFOVP9_28 [uncultured Caudovirales phage]
METPEKLIMLGARIPVSMMKELRMMCFENEISVKKMTELALRRQMAMVKFDNKFLQEQLEDKRA